MQSMVLVLCNHASVYLLVVLSLSSYLMTYGDILEGNEGIFTSKNKTRPKVRIPHGTIQGVNMVTHRGRNVFGFKGIPFAQPPVGSLRFKGPVAEKPWNGTLDASNESKLCPQLKGGMAIGDEDCLYLNVFTPQLPGSQNTTLLPVMVYIFGGAFKIGSPTSTLFNPHFILDKDVVLVVPSYRMGMLGYLSTGDEVSPGNYGLKDLVRALEWNRENVQYFGGDPSRVTIFGGSSGSISVDFLTLSNLTNGLFHRYITQSGSALASESLRPTKAFAKYAVRLGKYLGCSTNTSILLVNCLRTINASELIKAEPLFYVFDVLPILFWGPTVEPDIEGAFLTDTPTNLFATGKTRDVPRLCSAIQLEGVAIRANFYNRTDVLQDFLDKFDLIAPAILQYENLIDNVTAYTAALKSYYLNDLTANKNLLLDNITQLVSDVMWHYPTSRGLQQRFLHMKSPQYLCVLGYRGTFSHSYEVTGGDTVDWGVVHGDEILYLFQHPNGFYGPPEHKMNEADYKMVDTIVQFWTSFATSGTPTTSDPNCTTIWEPYSSRKNYLQIGSNSDVSLEVKYNFFEDRLQFWEELTASTLWK